MNIYDIARLSGVSIATVSRVVNGSDKVTEKTRQKVLAVIEEAGYTPNAFAQGLGLNTMHTIGILVPDISDLYMSSAVSCLEEHLHRAGYECILSSTGFEPERKQNHVQMLLSKRIDALILVGSTYAGNGTALEQTQYIRDAAGKVPVFMINGLVKGDGIHCAVCRDRDAIYEVTSSLIAKGRKRILFLTDSQSYSARQKMEGYEQALKEKGLPVRGELKLRIAKNDIHYVRNLLLEYSRLEFDSVIATEDAMAVGAVKYALSKGFRIPEDMEITGYNNSVLAAASNPELTSVDSRLPELCSAAAEGLIRILQGKNDVPSETALEPVIVKRETTDF